MTEKQLTNFIRHTLAINPRRIIAEKFIELGYTQTETMAFLDKLPFLPDPHRCGIIGEYRDISYEKNLPCV